VRRPRRVLRATRPMIAWPRAPVGFQK
jgi:hypothetical protein